MRFCENCGNAMENDNQMFCTKCGSSMQGTTATNLNGYGIASADMYQMKWYKFLIYVALFLGAAGNFITGILYLTGSYWDVQVGASGASRLIYAMFGGLHTADILYGLVLIALAAFAIFVRFQLAGFKKDGPKFLYILYIASSAVSVLYLIIAYAAIQSTLSSYSSYYGYSGSVPLNIWPTVLSVVVTAVVVYLNYIYFTKRAELFRN